MLTEFFLWVIYNEQTQNFEWRSALTKSANSSKNVLGWSPLPIQQKIKYDKSFLDEDYKRKVTDPVLAQMKEIAEERGLTLKQMAGAVLK